ncbi:uncharacterized protein LOC122073725 [Macadamia integrifolia]|uniref:uncharacterized protein LOC122073725 n=1 Tax=Macadamia integrifolia TaxID=60698 RepID=UPI001C4F6F88|nr:uncharacterized protein LOC122073725 [Macadamia integrifolia]
MSSQLDKIPLEKRPGILIVGSPNVGKRTLLSRLLALDFDDASDSSSEVLSYGYVRTNSTVEPAPFFMAFPPPLFLELSFDNVVHYSINMRLKGKKLFLSGLSVDGDLQGVERLFGALSARMWPGMVLKSGNKIPEPSFPDKEVLSEEESDYEVEYEILSAGSSEPWDGTEEVWVSASGKTITTETGSSSAAIETVSPATEDVNGEHKTNGSAYMLQPSDSEIPSQEDRSVVVSEANETDKATEPDDGTHLGLEELEQLMSEIGNMRDSLRLMPDFQRRDMAAKLAMKVATLFGDASDDEGNFD